MIQPLDAIFFSRTFQQDKLLPFVLADDFKHPLQLNIVGRIVQTLAHKQRAAL